MPIGLESTSSVQLESDRERTVNIVFLLRNPENKNYLRSMLYRNFLLAYEKAIGGRKIASGGQLMSTRGAGRILDGPWMM